MSILKSTRLHLKKDGSVDAVRKYLSTTREYYAQEGQSLGGNPILPDAAWLDSPAAQRMGLNKPGQDQDEDFAKILAGYHPRTGKPLVQNAGEAGRCMAVDLTFSPRKEYSLAFISASPEEREQMTEALRRARDKALALISSGLNTRAGKGGHRQVDIDGLLVRSVDHIDSRAGDPQWHCHAVVANVALDKDGKWRSVDFQDLMRTKGSLQEAAQEVFARELAEGFMALGFGIERARILDEDERDTGKVANKIVGIDQATCDAFSTRRAQIKEGLAKAAAEGKTTDATTVAKSTRQAKHMSASEVIVHARERLEELAALTPGHFIRASELKGRESVELEKQKSPLEWFDELHAMDSHWNRSSLIAKLARELPLGSGIDIPAEADRLLEQWEAEGTIIRLKDDPKFKQPRWCSRDQWFLELTVLPAARKRADEQEIRLDRADVEKAIAEHEAAMSKKLGKDIQLSDEQKASVFHVASETGGLACIIGQAGTGKSASAGAYVRAFKAAGRRVIGTSTSQAATDNLRDEAEIEGKNTAELLHALDKGKLTLTENDVIVLDEAGMVGAKTFRRIQKHVDKAGAKLIAVGDPKQLEAIEAGGPFAQLCEKFGAAAITQIMRQKDLDARSLAESFYNENKTGSDIVEEMLTKGMLRKEKHQVKALARAYLDDERTVQDKLIVVHTHADGKAVDGYVREGLKERGQLAQATAKTLTLGSGEYERELEICIGERIRFQKNDRKDKAGKRRWNNNDIGTVVSFKRATSKRGLTLVVQLDDGRKVDVDTDQFQRFGYAYARTAHSAQGLGAESVYWLARGGMIDRNAGLVAMTRTKSNFHAFASPQEVEKLTTALDEWGKKETVIELARRGNAPVVSSTLGQPLVAGSADAPVATDDVAQIKRQQAEEQRARAAEIQRAKRDIDWAEDEWAVECDQERSRVEVKIENAEAAIARYEGLYGDDEDIDPVNVKNRREDGPLFQAIKKDRDKARREIARFEKHLAVLSPQTSEDHTRSRKEFEAWLDKRYAGGSQAAFEDERRAKMIPTVASYLQRAKQMRAKVLEQERAVEMAIASIEIKVVPRTREEKVAEIHGLAEQIIYRNQILFEDSEWRGQRLVQQRHDRADALWRALQDEQRRSVEDELATIGPGVRHEELTERLAVLKGSSRQHRQIARAERKDWMKKNYPGGVQQAVDDMRLLDANEDAVKKRYQEVSARWREERKVEQQSIRAELDLGVAGQARQKLVDRLAVLERSTEAGRRADDADKKSWMKKHYPGGEPQAWYDKKIIDELIARRKREREIVLGEDTTTPLDKIDWETSRFPARRDKAVQVGAAAAPAQQPNRQVQFPELKPKSAEKGMDI